MESILSLRRRLVFSNTHCLATPRITPAQWGVLILIEQGSGNTVKDVARALAITSSAATQLVDGLVASGYVARKVDAKDRRMVTLTLSQGTKNHVSKMKRRVMRGVLQTFGVLSDKEINQFLALVQKLIRGLPDTNK